MVALTPVEIEVLKRKDTMLFKEKIRGYLKRGKNIWVDFPFLSPDYITENKMDYWGNDII